MTTSTSSAVEQRTPRADCIADSAGGITFDLAVPASPDAVLVLKPRSGKDAADEVRLPLTPLGDGSSRAVLPSTVELAEGHWDVLLSKQGVDGGDAVEPGIRDLRALLDRAPHADRITARVPCPAAGGRLALRCWARAPHAEAGDIGFAPQQGALTVEGLLYGAEPAEGAVAEARLHSGELVHEVPVTGEGRTFAFTLPCRPMAGRPLGKGQVWDLWLRPAADAPAIRISRILDDIWDRKDIFVYPRLTTDTCHAAAFYTNDNDLCLRLTEAG
ncbi:hypothetical protein HRW23_31970 [Streptomyces lunaelactis]|uniref:hypothetical protein n=1 Tax=Streptomyces lunaelactis TaxID=1535768 RepID=UPI001584A168|nr:hypothetical protein [Streptomyces lunaelactis]NUK09152.1 hypothetical protein [Streptomyces lunaelactis]NUK23564.1 hypothetical protein [Streptomyces lunaelactis]NUK34026.1 hypothetical protein [Streptomyces lunaelactis]NUK41919.1 hypothetical protein [Streptomyces lunaelactis]NUK50969.1 hypothetical protein [Streptomyces lunaelactis]